MSDTQNRESAPAPQGEAIAATPIAMDSGAAAQAAPAAPKSVRIAESSFEAAHADLPPLSTLGDATPATVTESIPGAPAGPRRGRGRSAAGGKFGAPVTTKTPIGAIENPADMTESLSGKYVSGYTDAPNPAPRRGQAAPAEAPAAESAPAEKAEVPAAEQPAASVIKEFVPPVSEGTFKAELNPEAERKAREERRQQRDQRPQGEPRPARDQRPQGGEFRGNREQGEQRPRGERPERAERQDRGERGPRGDQANRNGESNRRGDRPNRPGRLTIEAPKIPVQEELSFFGKIKRFISEKIWGVPASDKVEYKSVSPKPTPHSRDWQFGPSRGGQDRGQGGRGEFRHGNHRGGDNRGNPNRDGRHRPHARGGNHRDRHERDGNPRG